jgi:hypothetical protein
VTPRIENIIDMETFNQILELDDDENGVRASKIPGLDTGHHACSFEIVTQFFKVAKELIEEMKAVL